MSREAVNGVIERAVKDDSFFDLLKADPARALDGYDLDDAEKAPFIIGAYNVVVKAKRQDLTDEAEQKAARLQREGAAAAAAALSSSSPTPSATSGPPRSGLLGFLLGLVVVAAGLGGFRYIEGQWPWQAFSAQQASTAGSIPAATLGARPTPVSGTASRPPQTRVSAAPAPSVSSRGSASAASTPGSPSASPSAASQASASPSSSAAGDSLEVQKAYYQSVGERLSGIRHSFLAAVVALRGNTDPTRSLTDLSAELQDLSQHVADAPPPQTLAIEHRTLVAALPLLQGDVDVLKTALAHKDTLQAILIATEMESVFTQMQDELTFAAASHPEFYQPVASTQPLNHVADFQILSQDASQQGASISVQMRIALDSKLNEAELVDTLHHGIIAARQNVPAATQVTIIGVSSASGANPAQLGQAAWYCGPNDLPPGAASTAKWQDSCNKVYVTAGTGKTTQTVPY